MTKRLTSGVLTCLSLDPIIPIIPTLNFLEAGVNV